MSEHDGNRREEVRWLIERFDNLTAHVSNRAAVVLTADSILLAGATFMIDKLVGTQERLEPFWLIVCIVLALVLTIVLLTASLFLATSGVITVWTISKKLLGPNPPSRLVYHTRDTFDAYRDFNSFDEGFAKLSDADLQKYALGELWTVMKLNHYRYQQVRWSIRFALLALPCFVLALLAMLGRYIVQLAAHA